MTARTIFLVGGPLAGSIIAIRSWMPRLNVVALTGSPREWLEGDPAAPTEIPLQSGHYGPRTPADDQAQEWYYQPDP